MYPRDNPLPRKHRNLQAHNPNPMTGTGDAQFLGTSRGCGTAPDSINPPTEAAHQVDLNTLPGLIQRLNDTLMRVGEAPPRYERNADERV